MVVVFLVNYKQAGRKCESQSMGWFKFSWGFKDYTNEAETGTKDRIARDFLGVFVTDWQEEGLSCEANFSG